jgi:hypothetical protein
LTPVAWIARQVEARGKREGFRWFDRSRGFPYLTEAELAGLSGRTRLLTHGMFSPLPGAGVRALSVDVTDDEFLRVLNGAVTTPVDEIAVVHASCEPTGGPRGRFGDLNVDVIFGEANDTGVPYTGAEAFDEWQEVGSNYHFGTVSEARGEVMHTNFFRQRAVHDRITAELTAMA